MYGLSASGCTAQQSRVRAIPPQAGRLLVQSGGDLEPGGHRRIRVPLAQLWGTDPTRKLGAQREGRALQEVQAVARHGRALKHNAGDTLDGLSSVP